MQFVWPTSASISLFRRGSRVFDSLLLLCAGGSYEGFHDIEHNNHCFTVAGSFNSSLVETHVF